MQGKFLVRLLACGVCAILLCSTRVARADDIVLGEYGSLTGDTATFGISCDEGARLALDQINDAGGVLGRKVKVVIEDDQSKPEEAVNAVLKLINQDKAVAIIGEVASTRSLAGAAICQRSHVPMLSPASTNPKVTKVGNYIFRNCFTDNFQGWAMAHFAMTDLKIKRFAVLYDVTQDYSTGLRDFFKEAVKKDGGQIVADESYSGTDIDFRPQLSKIKNAQPDAIYVPGYYTQVGSICKQARDLGITVPLLGGDGWDSDRTAATGGDAVNGCYFTNHYSADQDRPEVKQFVDAYKKKYNGKTPDAMAILGYDAMRLMCDAITRAKSTKDKDIRDALAATKDFPGASGTITIDADRNAKKPIVVIKFENGKMKFVTEIKP
jgi:branched-chain amino acid transport system substrate-binding protein